MTHAEHAGSELGDRFGLGPLNQVSFAVADMAASLPWYEAMFGEFRVHEGRFSPELVSYRGKPCTASLLVGHALSGAVDIELIEVTGGSAPQRDHIEQYGAGLHHIAFRVPEPDRQCPTLEAAGFTIVLDGRSLTGTRFCYLEPPPELGSLVIEIHNHPGPEHWSDSYHGGGES